MALDDKVSAHIGPIIKRSMIIVRRSPRLTWCRYDKGAEWWLLGRYSAGNEQLIDLSGKQEDVL